MQYEFKVNEIKFENNLELCKGSILMKHTDEIKQKSKLAQKVFIKQTNHHMNLNLRDKKETRKSSVTDQRGEDFKKLL